MGILNRLLLLPYAILGMALAVAVAAAALRILPESIWLNELRYFRISHLLHVRTGSLW